MYNKYPLLNFVRMNFLSKMVSHRINTSSFNPECRMPSCTGLVKDAFRRMLLPVVLLLISFSCFAQLPKRVYITLDVSGSMAGNKYIMANYAAQTISVLCDESDEVFLYYLGHRHSLSSRDSYKTLHKAFDALPPQKNNYYEVSDIAAFLDDYKSDPSYQDWLFIIGDGHWDWSQAEPTYRKATEKFRTLIQDAPLQVCYLQTGDMLSETYSFTEFLTSLSSPKIEIRKSDTSASSVAEQCRAYANRILGFSNTPIMLEQTDGNTISFKSDYPLESFLLMYQSTDKSASTKLESISSGGVQIPFKEKGNPSTAPLITRGASVIEGSVWESDSGTTIPEGQTVTAVFSGNVNSKDMTLYPYVDAVLHMTPHSLAGGALSQRADGVFELCEKEDQVLLRIDLRDKKGAKLSPALMMKSDVTLISGGTTLPVTFEASDTSFHCTIKMPSDSVSYRAEAESRGYFSRISPTQSVIKAAVCPPDIESLITLPEQIFSSILFSSLEEGNEFGGGIDDSLLVALLMEGEFDKISFQEESKSPLGSASIEMHSNRISFKDFRPIKGLCECAFPDALRFQVFIQSTEGILHDGKLYQGFIVPVTVPVDKSTWLVRCRWVIIAIIGLILFFFYLAAITKKRRFGKNSRIEEYYTELFSEQQYGRKKLREKGFAAWFKRWFIPFVPERRTLRFNASVPVLLHLEASHSSGGILINGSDYDEEKMTLEGHIASGSGKVPKKQIRWGNNQSMELAEGRLKGRLKYNNPLKSDDIGIFKLFLGILKVVVILSIVFLLYILSQSL